MAMVATSARDTGKTGTAKAWRPARSTIVSIVSVAVFFILWQVAPDLGWVNGRFTSQPSQVFLAAIEVLLNDDFFYHARISLTEFFLGFALALVVSIPLGVLLGTSQTARYLIDPPLMALYIAPTLVLLPILVVWLGIGMASKVAVVFLGALFPIVVNTMAGMREADPKLIRAARSFGASRLDVFVRILVPGSLPSILTGIRLAVGRAVLGVVVGELFVSQAGIGYQLNTYGSAMRIDRLLVYALVVSAFGYTLTVLVRALEGRVRTWRPE
ncbi:ABC transporter permease [Chelativorans sp. J32]|uniref:ABC transporter permease n=1 Tax=Chelativorans sp. J32 TaxID=935840 RepID=UPI0004B0A376|nr:ABC transporter permease [Chelativorans sp. J32]